MVAGPCVGMTCDSQACLADTAREPDKASLRMLWAPPMCVRPELRRYSRYSVSRYNSDTAGVYKYSRYSNRG
eukprot:407082-Prymnesium_polylepis.1